MARLGSPTPTPAPAQSRSARVHKRVDRACDYCRKKRLKCTADQRPCLNCQLYKVECTASDRGRRCVARVPRPESVAPVTQAPAVHVGQDTNVGALRHSQHADTDTSPGSTQRAGFASSTALDSSIDLQTGFPAPADDTELCLAASQWDLARSDMASDVDNSTGAHSFGDTLRQLGLSSSSEFWDWDRPGIDDFSASEPRLMPSVVQHSIVDGSGMPTAPLLSGDNVRQHEHDASHWHKFTAAARPSTISSAGKVYSLDALTQKDASERKVHQSLPPGIFIRKDEAVANHIGFSSVGATLALCLKHACESQQYHLQSSSLGFLVEAGPYVDEVGLLSSADLQLQQLPSQDTAVACIDAYFQQWNNFYPIVHEASFRTRLDMLYGSTRGRLSAADYCIFYLVVSLGAIYADNLPEQSVGLDRLSSDAHQQAWSMMHDIIASPCEASLQVLLLHVIHQLYHGRQGIAWVFCGLAIRTAQSLGFHRQMPSDMHLTEPQLSLRYHLWWVAFAFDALLSLSQGRPPAVANGAYDIEIVPIVSDPESEESLSPLLSQLYAWTYQFMQIQNRFCNMMNVRFTGASRLQSLAQINGELAAWKDSLPDECRPGRIIIASQERFPHVVLLHLNYFNLCRAIHWAAIPLASAWEDSPEKVNTHVRKSEALCLYAARSFIETLNESTDGLSRNKISPRSFHTNDCMAAMAVLYRSISKNPTKLSTRADLEHLRAGKLHLGRDTPEGVAGPALQALFVSMLTSAEEMVCRNNYA